MKKKKKKQFLNIYIHLWINRATTNYVLGCLQTILNVREKYWKSQNNTNAYYFFVLNNCKQHKTYSMASVV